jgi:hypothetical protein
VDVGDGGFDRRGLAEVDHQHLDRSRAGMIQAAKRVGCHGFPPLRGWKLSTLNRAISTRTEFSAMARPADLIQLNQRIVEQGASDDLAEFLVQTLSPGDDPLVFVRFDDPLGLIPHGPI